MKLSKNMVFLFTVVFMLITLIYLKSEQKEIIVNKTIIDKEFKTKYDSLMVFINIHQDSIDVLNHKIDSLSHSLLNQQQNEKQITESIEEIVNNTDFGGDSSFVLFSEYFERIEDSDRLSEIDSL